MIRLLLLIGLVTVTACTAAPTALPEDFSSDFEF